MRITLGTALSVTAVSMLAAGAPSAAAAPAPGPGARVAIASTAPTPGAGPLRVLAAGTQVRLTMFVGRDQAGLTAAATEVSDPASPDHGHYLSPAQVQDRFGATAAQRRAVDGWLSGAGLAVTHDDGFVISAAGPAARAEAAVHAGLGVSHRAGSTEQVVPSRAMSVPAAVADAVITIRVSTAAVPLSPHLPLNAASPTAPGAEAAASTTGQCSAYYGQKQATGLPHAYGQTITWAPCGYTPAQLRHAYGAAQAKLTGAGASVAVISQTSDPTALSDADRWARQQHIPQFAPGQFKAYIAKNPGGGGVEENAMDIEAVHGMAPAALADPAAPRVRQERSFPAVTGSKACSVTPSRPPARSPVPRQASPARCAGQRRRCLAGRCAA